MVRITIEKIVWNKWNEEHIKKHSVSTDEVENVVHNLIAYKQGYNGRYILIGRSNNRLISVIVSRKTAKTYYVVTARDSDKKERKIVYDKENK